MTAYSFKARFVEPIQAGTKRQTIRERGRRPHARPGGLVQLYTGMRTKACRKIVPDVVCESVAPVVIDLRRWTEGGSLRDVLIDLDGIRLRPFAYAEFARDDGFDTFAELVRFWIDEHGPILFEGVRIRWREVEHGTP